VPGQRRADWVTGGGVIGGVVLDATALADLAENRTPCAGEVVDYAITTLRTIAIPTTVLMECWARVPEQSQVFLATFVAKPVVTVHELDEATAIDAGELAAAVDAPDTPAGTMHAVHVARGRGWPLLTTEPDVARHLDPDVRIEPLP
jgi:hypothetical protein